MGNICGLQSYQTQTLIAVLELANKNLNEKYDSLLKNNIQELDEMIRAGKNVKNILGGISVEVVPAPNDPPL